MAKKYYMSASVIHPDSLTVEIKPINRQKVIELLCVKNNFNRKENIRQRIWSLQTAYKFNAGSNDH